ncbi:MAG: hypothetical protein ACYC27_13270 [Armatimonadota bacterium]
MSPTTIAGTPVDISISRAPQGGWVAFGRIYEGVLPGKETIKTESSSRKEAESQCRDMLERLIHVRTCGTE